MSIVTFREIRINEHSYGKSIFKVYYVIDNNRSSVIESFNKLDEQSKKNIKVIISKMATCKNFQSKQIKWNLKKYNFGEIRPKPHRYFFFRVFEGNLIFFAHVVKKVNSLSDSFYKTLQEKKDYYEKEFKKQHK